MFVNNDLQPAYVLHVRDYRESSGLVDFITADDGRMTLLAKAYKSGRQRKNFLQPFRKLAIAWSGRGDLKTLKTAEEIQAPWVLESRALMSGLYVNELLTRMLHPHDPHPEIFTLYEKTLSMLTDTTSFEPILRQYEIAMLEAVGYGLMLDTDIDGNVLEPSVRYCYVLESGPVRSEKPIGNSPVMSGKTLNALASGYLHDDDTLKESKQLMRYVLTHYIGEKPLKTRELFRYY